MVCTDPCIFGRVCSLLFLVFFFALCDFLNGLYRSVYFSLSLWSFVFSFFFTLCDFLDGLHRSVYFWPRLWFFLFFFDVVRLLEWFARIHVFLAEFVVFCFFYIVRLLGWFAPIRVFLAEFVVFYFFFDVVRLLGWTRIMFLMIFESSGRRHGPIGLCSSRWVTSKIATSVC